MHRRDLLKSAAGAGAALATTGRIAAAAPVSPDTTLADGAAVRAAWVERLTRICAPVLEHLAAGRLRQSMPVEGAADRAAVTHLEAIGRTLAGAAPWLELPADTTTEGPARARLQRLAREALAQATDPRSPDAMNFTEGAQPLVDAAFLAHALVRAPGALWGSLPAPVQQRLVRALVSTRRILPFQNNWLLFSAMVEAALCRVGAPWDAMRVDYAVRQHVQWYKGDGLYGDGPTLHVDYYNSYVIHPMLLDVLTVCAPAQPAWAALLETAVTRARRYAVILERHIAPDGSFPVVGRSLAYRCGAFQALAQVALRRELPATLPPAQVRSALDAVIGRTIDAPNTFDAAGWLRIGLAGSQPGIGERYISTGSLYLCTTAFLPLGLPATDPFWTGPGLQWTSRVAWAGEPFPIDAALKEP